MKQGSYLLDTNCFVSAWQLYYRRSFAPAFWAHLASLVDKGTVVILDSVYNEVVTGDDDLCRFLKQYKPVVQKPDQNVLSAYAEVLQTVQINIGKYYKETALQSWSAKSVADPWLIASAKVNNAIIVTQEESAINNITAAHKAGNGSLMKSAKIPDVACMMGIQCINLYDFIETNGFQWVKNGNS